MDRNDTLTSRFILLVSCVWLLSSCVTPKTQAPTTAPTPVSTAPTQAVGAQHYRISSEQSQLHILVYRGGSMAQLGHNHVISSNSIKGEAWLHDSLDQSGFNIEFPVNDLIVDDAEARAEEGSDFVSKVNDEARAGTKRNMLKPELLDGEHYPTIQLLSSSITGTREAPQVVAQITIKDQTREVTLPIQLIVTLGTLRATGQFEIRQTDFGITPFSVLMGALQVLDRLTIKFDLVMVLVN